MTDGFARTDHERRAELPPSATRRGHATAEAPFTGSPLSGDVEVVFSGGGCEPRLVPPEQALDSSRG